MSETTGTGRRETQMSETTARAQRPEDNGTPSRTFGRAFWMLNVIEAFERLAYFGVRYVAPIYIMQATEPGGLHLTAVQKGWIYMWWALFQSFLPIITGGYADRYGYKRVLFFAISANVIGYLMMAFLHSYYGFFAGIIVLATGTAFFKPSLQGSIAQNLTKESSSVGWGIFYWVVNVGAFASPFLTTLILGKPHSEEGWRNLFLCSAGFTALNLLMLFTFEDVPSGASKSESALEVLGRTLRNIAEPRLIAWLAIMSCFWLMMYQLWDLHPNFIEDWVDSSMIARHMPFDSWTEYGDRGLVRVPQQILISLNAGLIIVLMIPVSWLVRRMRTLGAMLIGMTVATGGVVVAGLTSNGLILLLGIFFFSVGEMLTGPKKNEYLALIAPPGKKGLYLGYVNIPVGVGVAVGSLIAGLVYDQHGEKASLALKHMATDKVLFARAAQSADWSDGLDKAEKLLRLDRSAALAEARSRLGDGGDGALVAAYRQDSGQLVNLALQYLALHPDHRDKGYAGRTDADIAAEVPKIAETIGVKRQEALALVREAERQKDPGVTNEAVAVMLWERFGAHPENLTNLALEYLAQGTPLVHDAVAGLELESPVDDIPKKTALSRTKAFSALAAALGASGEDVEQHLREAFPDVSEDHRAFVDLMGRKHVRFMAVARFDWENDLALLERLVSGDEAVAQAAAQAPGRAPDIEELAGDMAAVQRALDAKDWARAPELAAQLLGMSRFEAHARVRAELAGAPEKVTRLLWDTYGPQYRVWIPFAAIGLLATIALAVFGRMARRWSDMDA